MNPTNKNTSEENPLIQAVREAGEQAQQAQQAISKDVALQQDITDNIIALSAGNTVVGEQAAVAAEGIESQKDIAELAVRSATIEAYLAGGGRELTTKLLVEKKGAVEDLLKAENEVEAVTDEYSGSGFLGSLMQGFKLMGPGSRLEAAQKRVGILDTAIQGVSTSVESVRKAELATAKTMTDATLEQLTAQRAATAELAANRLKLESLAANSTAIARNIQATDAGRRAAIANYEIYNKEENRKQRKVQHEFQMRQWKAQETRSEATFKQSMKQWKEWGSDRATAARNIRNKQIIEDDASYTDQANAAIVGQALAGQEPFTLEVAKGILRSGRPQEKDMMYRWMAAGLRGSFGSSPAESARFIAAVANEGNAPRGPAVKHIVAIQQEMGNVMAKPGTDAYDRAFTTTANKVVEDWDKKIKQGDTSNPYHAKPASVILNFPDLQKLPTVSKILAPLGMKEWNVQRVADEIVSGVIAGEVDLEQANSDYNKIYRAIVEHNSEVEAFDRAGLPRQKKYNAKLVEPVLISESPYLQPAEQILFGGMQKLLTQDEEVIDHMDATQSMRWLLKLKLIAERNNIRQNNLNENAAARKAAGVQ